MGCLVTKNDSNNDFTQQNIKQNANNLTTRENSIHKQTSNSLDSIIIDCAICSKKKLSREDFKFLKVLGRGTFGKVYLVQNKQTEKYYALKILKKNQLKQIKQKEQLYVERKILERMLHPFIVSLCFAFQTDKHLFFGTEVVLGGELFLHMKKSQRFSEKRAKFYIAQIILALQYLHANGIIYRDLKPENVLLEQDGYIKITDFGLAKEGMDKQAKAYTYCGTPEYLAPEIICGIGYTKAVDWWSLGVLLYEMLTGKSLFQSENPMQTFDKIMKKEIEMQPYFSNSVKSLLTGLLCQNPKLRLGGSINDAEEIKQHSFFSNIDWNKMYNKSYDAPYKPIITNCVDTQNFDPTFTEEPIQDTPYSTQYKLEHYFGFSFLKHSLLDVKNEGQEKVESTDWLQEDQ